MLNSKGFEYDCTRRCRLRSHGNAITAALTKRSVDDKRLAAYVAKTCANYTDIVDDSGRSAVHMTSSVDRYDILEWLLNRGAIISDRDYESGNTPLHRAVFYGCIDCAVLLMRYGASMEALNEDTQTPLQQVCRLCDSTKMQTVPPNNELLVWGSNKNYNLGINNDQNSDQTPQMLDYFRKEQVSVKMVALGGYHSLFLDRKGNVYSVGHGKGGRLGIQNENSLSTPKKVKLSFKNVKEEVICVSVSRYHSLLLTDHSNVLACGLNNNAQLGLRDAGEKLLSFKMLQLRENTDDNLRKVIARDYHSLAFSDKCIYVWGTNIGQMGIDANAKTVPVPQMMKLPPKTLIQDVEANNVATVVVTKENTIILFHNFKTRIIKAPNYESLKSVAVVEGDTSKSEKGNITALKLVILTQTNVVFLWYQLTQNFYRCSFPSIRLTQIDKILFKANRVLILSQGDVYTGKCQHVPMPQQTNSEAGTQPKEMGNIWSRSDYRSAEMAKDYMLRIDLQQIIHTDRAVDIVCDDDFASFAVLQESAMKYFKLPALNPEEYTFKKLYHDASENDDVHDVVFHVDGENFAAHKLLIYARASGLKAIVSSCQDKVVNLNLQYLTGKMFEIMLKFIYTNYLPNEQDLQDIQSSLHSDGPTELQHVCKLFSNFVEQFQITNLANYLKSHMQEHPIYLPNAPDKSKYRFNRLKHSNYPDLYDVRIVCENGMEIPAHKCVLVARLEYFEMMFTHAWSEQTTINLTTVPYEYMEAIVTFLYSQDVEQFRKQQHRESFLYNMIVLCDQFFIERLRKVCEMLLLDKISIRKCGEMLDFATSYNCEVMQKGCLNFICQNLARVLLQKSLYNCEPDALGKINHHYREMFKDVFDYRMITPSSEAVDDDCLASFVEDFQVDLSYRMSEEEQSQYCALNKSKSKDSKQSKQTTTRQHEKDAISAMAENLNVSKNSEKKIDNETSTIVNECAAVGSKLQAEVQSWRKVTPKKDQRKKSFVDQCIKVNNILKQEEVSHDEFIKLNNMKEERNERKSITPERETSYTEQAAPSSPSSRTYNVILADITSPNMEKMTQKQRKRLTSESKSLTSWRSPPIAENKTPSGSQTVNAWGNLPQSPPNVVDCSYDAAVGSGADPSSFANMIKTSKANTNIAASPSSSNCFSQILAEEKRQRDYYEKVRHKSLALTQIEEQAIVELRSFYNVSNITDEVITIERKPVTTTINFSSVWKKS